MATSEIDKNVKYRDANTRQPQNIDIDLDTAEQVLDEPDLNSSLGSGSSFESMRFFRESRRNILYDSTDDEGALNDSIQRYEDLEDELIPDDWDPGEPVIVKYVDDVLGTEKIFPPAGKLHSTTRKQSCIVYAKKIRRSDQLYH